MQIKFSHNYPKLHGQKSAQLLKIELHLLSELSAKFIEYDTVHETGHYPLSEGQYIILVFLGNEFIPFTTARRYTKQKHEYYKDNLRNVFDIKIGE